MKLRLFSFIALLALLLTACNLSLAEDVTPPPGYVSPTPAPTLGPLFPPQAPNPENGAAIYADKCAACHGPKGMGDGDQGKQLPVTVPALALPQTARAASMADWYKIVTNGEIQNFMPPFASLSEQQRWDVVAYAQSLHTTPDELAQGKALFESNCANCPLDYFKDQTAMAAINGNDLASLLKNGNDKVTALTGNLSADQLYAVADYLRTLTFASSLPTPTVEPATATPAAVSTEATTAGSTTPAAAGTESTTTAVETGTPVMEPSATPMSTEASTTATTPVVKGKVTGSVNGTNVGGLTVTLHGYDHASDSSGPKETLTLTGVTAPDGSYEFDNVDLPDGRIFLAEITYGDVTYQAEMALVANGATSIVIAPLKVYPSVNDYSTLSFDDTRFFLTVTEQSVQVIGVYTISNKTQNTITVDSTSDVPFLSIPAGSTDTGFDLTQDSAAIMRTTKGFAIPPSDKPYGFVTYYSLAYSKKLTVAQKFLLPTASVMVLAPEGVTIKSTQLTPGGTQVFQQTNYQEYTGGSLKAGDVLTYEVTGQPKTPLLATSSQQNILIGVGALGLVLILAGVWLYVRDRNSQEETEELQGSGDEFETQDELLDAIIALDDSHRAGKISDEAYQKRRAELKARLKNME